MEWEGRGDLASILRFLPVVIRSSGIFWPSRAVETLRALSLGPDVSRARSGEVLFGTILDLRDSLCLDSQELAPGTAFGFIFFFDELISSKDARVWFNDVVPAMARLLLRLPSLLEEHYMESDEQIGRDDLGLRIMERQEPGIVFLSQELIAALLSCAMFCLFPTRGRKLRYLPIINFDHLFASLHGSGKQYQEHKMKCLVHYFERICSKMLTGCISFERKVLSLGNSDHGVAYPTAASWTTSTVSLCSFEVFSSGLIEDQPYEAIEVDFANEYLGGGALTLGCVQEEIRFMINPELIIGMLFMPSMNYNEAIEIIGVEMFSSYTGYGSTFQFIGDYQDNKLYDLLGRRKTRIVAIDALCRPGIKQFEAGSLIRETNKAFCGFLDQSKYKCSIEAKDTGNSEEGSSEYENLQVIDPQVSVGIATGNWGCGAFGGDPEIKSMIQWLAASQGLRPFIHYYTFGEGSLRRLEEVTRWILQQGWTVGDLWNMMTDYSNQRLLRQTNLGFLAWLLPCNETGGGAPSTSA